MEIADKIEVCYNSVQRHLTDLCIRYPIKITTGGRDSAGVQLQPISSSINKLLTYDELNILIISLNCLVSSKEIEILKLKLSAYLEFSKNSRADTPAITSVRSINNGQVM